MPPTFCTYRNVFFNEPPAQPRFPYATEQSMICCELKRARLTTPADLRITRRGCQEAGRRWRHRRHRIRIVYRFITRHDGGTSTATGRLLYFHVTIGVVGSDARLSPGDISPLSRDTGTLWPTTILRRTLVIVFRFRRDGRSFRFRTKRPVSVNIFESFATTDLREL